MAETLLITYPDAVYQEHEKPLETLSRLQLDVFDAVHILPFFPSTSDHGFAITDYLVVDSQYGTWEDIPTPFMVDAVFNHTSRSHPWFTSHNEYYKQYKTPPQTTLFRPRKHPLFTQINDTHYWTTFSEDQIDLDLENSELQEELEKIIKFYIQKGATYIRLDAAPYLFKDIDAINTSETHAYIQHLIQTFPDITFVAEVNRHQNEIDEYSKYVCTYDFALPALMYYTMLTHDIAPLHEHLQTNTTNSFHILATHDGIGLSAVHDIIPTQLLIDDVRQKGYHANEYELNINYLDAVETPEKFLCAHAILCMLGGPVGIYYHSYFGSRGIDSDVPRETNREKYEYQNLKRVLSLETEQAHIHSLMKKLLHLRKTHLQDTSHQVSVQNTLLHITNSDITCICNISSETVSIDAQYDLITETTVDTLQPFGFVWVR